MPSTTISNEMLKHTMLTKWADASKTYGDGWSVPRDESFALGEYERAMHILLLWKNEGEKGNPIRQLRAYGVMESVIIQIVADWCDMTITEDVLSEVKTEKRSDKYNAFTDWTKDKVGQQFTTDALVAEAGFSYITVLKFLGESPHFRKIKKGLWEIRDPKADREAGL